MYVTIIEKGVIERQVTNEGGRKSSLVGIRGNCVTPRRWVNIKGFERLTHKRSAVTRLGQKWLALLYNKHSS